MNVVNYRLSYKKTLFIFEFILCLCLSNVGQCEQMGDADSYNSSETLFTTLELEVRKYEYLIDETSVGCLLLDIDFTENRALFLIYDEDTQNVYYEWVKESTYFTFAQSLTGRCGVYLSSLEGDKAYLNVRWARTKRKREN